MVAQGHGKFGPIIVADPRKSFRLKKKAIFLSHLYDASAVLSEDDKHKSIA